MCLWIYRKLISSFLYLFIQKWVFKVLCKSFSRLKIRIRVFFIPFAWSRIKLIPFNISLKNNIRIKYYFLQFYPLREFQLMIESHLFFPNILNFDLYGARSFSIRHQNKEIIFKVGPDLEHSFTSNLRGLLDSFHHLLDINLWNIFSDIWIIYKANFISMVWRSLSFDSNIRMKRDR